MVKRDSFWRTTTRDSSGPIDHTAGRASLVDGTIIYSPNCGRSVHMPYERNVIENLRSSSTTDVDVLLSPLWWAEDTAYLAFLPLQPEFNGVPFEQFNNPSLTRHRRIYTIGAGTSVRWRHEEFNLQCLIRQFSEMYHIPKAKSFVEHSAIHCGGYFEFPSKFRIQLKRTKGWLSLLIAELAYVLAIAQQMDGDGPGEDMLPKWFTGLHREDQVRLSGIRSSIARYTYFIERVGVFLKLGSPLNHISVDFLLRYCVPVWYPWTSAEIAAARDHPRLRRLGPLPEQLQRATQFLTQHVSSKASAIEDRPWVEFFERRKRDQAVLSRNESDVDRQRRIDRERNPPTVNTKVYVWERDTTTSNFSRLLVFKRENEETLDRFESREKIYDGFWNEWHCCHAFWEPTAAEREEDDWFSDDDLDLPEVDALDVLRAGIPNPSSPPPNAHPGPTTPPAPSTVTKLSVARWEAHFTAQDRAHSYDVQAYPATEILHYFFGFVPPIPVPRKHPRPVKLTDKDFKLFAAIVNQERLEEVFQDSTIMQYCHQFVSGLERNRSPPNELFDLAVGNPRSVAGVRRIRSFVKRCNNVYSLALPAAEANVPWDLTVTSAMDALFLCRLDPSMTDLELCHVLIQRGVQFHTLLPISKTRVTPFPILPRVLPIRGAGYVFGKTDYDAYLEERVGLLRSTRICRAALMRGGIAWRLVVSEVSFPEVFQGPTTATTIHGQGMFLAYPAADYVLCDDELMKTEAEALSGLVFCYTGV